MPKVDRGAYAEKGPWSMSDNRMDEKPSFRRPTVPRCGVLFTCIVGGYGVLTSVRLGGAEEAFLGMGLEGVRSMLIWFLQRNRSHFENHVQNSDTLPGSESPKQDFLVSAEYEPSVTRNHRIFGRNRIFGNCLF